MDLLARVKRLSEPRSCETIYVNAGIKLIVEVWAKRSHGVLDDLSCYLMNLLLISAILTQRCRECFLRIKLMTFLLLIPFCMMI